MRTAHLLPAVALGIVLAACTPNEPTQVAQSVPAPAVTPAPAPAPIALPVSINAVMVALVDHASEPLWLADETAQGTDTHLCRFRL